MPIRYTVYACMFCITVAVIVALWLHKPQALHTHTNSVQVKTKVVEKIVEKKVKRADKIVKQIVEVPGKKTVTLTVVKPIEEYTLDANYSMEQSIDANRTNVTYTKTSFGIIAAYSYDRNIMVSIHRRIVGDFWLGLGISGSFKTIDYRDYRYWLLVSLYF